MKVSKVLDIPIYKGKLIIVLCDDAKELNLKGFDRKVLYAHAFVGEYRGYEGYYIILNPLNPHASLNSGTVAHESLHIVNMLFENRGVVYRLDEDEHACYLLDWITNSVHKFLKKENITLPF
jgi:hypothetical protein